MHEGLTRNAKERVKPFKPLEEGFPLATALVELVDKGPDGPNGPDQESDADGSQHEDSEEDPDDKSSGKPRHFMPRRSGKI
jgi:hypothetical protein